MDQEEIAKVVLNAAFKVHSVLGPGLLESVYEAALVAELRKHGMPCEQQKPIPVLYEGVELPLAFTADLIVAGLVLVELKSVEHVLPVHKKTVQTYLRLAGLQVGFLINFNECHLKDGILRVVFGVEGKPFISVDPRKGAERLISRPNPE
jgi:GxxExxY protein